MFQEIETTESAFKSWLPAITCILGPVRGDRTRSPLLCGSLRVGLLKSENLFWSSGGLANTLNFE